MGAIIRISLVFILLFTFSFAHARYGSTLCKKDPAYQCYKVKRGDTWDKLFSDPQERDVVKRINRMNIRLSRGMTIAIPHQLTSSILDFSPLAQKIDATGKKTIIVSISQLAFGAYDETGTLQHWGPISASRGYCPDIRRNCPTATGVYRIYQKQGPECVSTIYPVGRGGAPMPYCMFYHRGFALHGSYEVPGYHASHGCVRLFVDDARWLNQDFGADRHTTVIVRH